MAGWNNITVRILGRNLVGITQVDYSNMFDDEYLKGAGGSAVGYSKGNDDPKCKLDLYQEEVNEIISALPPGRKMRDIDPFDIIVSFEYKDKTITDIIKGCRFKGTGKSIGQGSKGIIQSFDLPCYDVLENVR